MNQKKRVKKQPKKRDDTMEILSHALSLFLGFLGPLIIYIATKNEDVKKHSAKSLNWQISLMIYVVILIILLIFSPKNLLFIIFFIIEFLLLIILGITNTIFCIIATIKASEGELWDYPLAIPFFR